VRVKCQLQEEEDMHIYYLLIIIIWISSTCLAIIITNKSRAVHFRILWRMWQQMT